MFKAIVMAASVFLLSGCFSLSKSPEQLEKETAEAADSANEEINSYPETEVSSQGLTPTQDPAEKAETEAATKAAATKKKAVAKKRKK